MSDVGLEFLLEENLKRSTAKVNAPYQKTDLSVQTADKGADLFELMKMINKLVTLTLKDLKVEFIPDEGKDVVLIPDQKIDHPYITYKIISRTPDKELKPRPRQEIREVSKDTADERYGEVWGQKFKSYIQFNIFASEYTAAEEVMEKFEELMFLYTGYFKKNGISELLFSQQLTDTDYNIFRQTISVRNLQYYVETEKLRVIFREKIKEVETYLSLEKEA
jgi:hypothetical protein